MLDGGIEPPTFVPLRDSEEFYSLAGRGGLERFL